MAVRWNGRFRIVNLVGQASAAMIGASIAYINYRLFKEPSLGHWIFGRGALLGVGYVFLFCLSLPLTALMAARATLPRCGSFRLGPLIVGRRYFRASLAAFIVDFSPASAGLAATRAA